MDLSKIKESNLIHLCFAITFFTSGLIINFVQCVLYIFLRPFNKYIYRKINYYLCASFYAQVVFLAEWWSGTEILTYVDKNEFDNYYGKEHAYCVMNHTFEVDWLMGWMFCDKIKCLGNCKAYAKKVIQYLPTLGWCWKFSEFVFLERSFDKDRDIINRQIAELADHPDPIWLLLFPEGTRFTPEKHKASLKFSKEKGLPELKHHLCPRVRGFIASLPSMRGKVKAVYDITLSFKPTDKVEPTITNLLFGRKIQAHFYMKRIPLEQVPEDEEEATKFLHDMFVRKDKLQDSFYKTGDFFAESGIERVEPFTLKRAYFSLINTVIWYIVILIPMVYYLIGLLFSGELLYFSIGAGIISLFVLLLKKSIGMSKISKGSSYGTNSPKKTD